MFLTLEDPRAKVQGSRDPLGVQPIWASFGRKLVTNLTTVTNSVRGFTVLLLGRYAAQRLVELGRIRDKEALPVFLRMEQVGAYARYVGHRVEGDIRGIERVQRFLSECGTSVPIQDDSSGMILSDQKTYGLWGLYSVAARVSGLISDGPVGVTPQAREFVEQIYWPRLRLVEDELLRLLEKGGKLRTDLRNPLFKAVVSVLPQKLTPQERKFYAETLRDARHVEMDGFPNRQALLAKLFAKHVDLASPVGRDTVLTLAKAARTEDVGLEDCLRKVARLEATFAPAEAIFDHLQARNGQTPTQIAKALLEHWGRSVPNIERASFREILPEIQTVAGEELATAIDRCDAQLGEARFEGAIEALLEWNRLVMAGRKAAPWVRIQAGKLDIRHRSVERTLPDAKALPILWRNAYFLDTLKDVTRQVGEPD